MVHITLDNKQTKIEAHVHAGFIVHVYKLGLIHWAVEITFETKSPRDITCDLLEKHHNGQYAT